MGCGPSGFEFAGDATLMGGAHAHAITKRPSAKSGTSTLNHYSSSPSDTETLDENDQRPAIRSKKPGDDYQRQSVSSVQSRASALRATAQLSSIDNVRPVDRDASPYFTRDRRSTELLNKTQSCERGVADPHESAAGTCSIEGYDDEPRQIGSTAFSRDSLVLTLAAVPNTAMPAECQKENKPPAGDSVDCEVLPGLPQRDAIPQGAERRTCRSSLSGTALTRNAVCHSLDVAPQSDGNTAGACESAGVVGASRGALTAPRAFRPASVDGDRLRYDAYGHRWTALTPDCTCAGDIEGSGLVSKGTNVNSDEARDNPGCAKCGKAGTGRESRLVVANCAAPHDLGGSFAAKEKVCHRAVVDTSTATNPQFRVKDEGCTLIPTSRPIPYGRKAEDRLEEFIVIGRRITVKQSLPTRADIQDALTHYTASLDGHFESVGCPPAPQGLTMAGPSTSRESVASAVATSDCLTNDSDPFSAESRYSAVLSCESVLGTTSAPRTAGHSQSYNAGSDTSSTAGPKEVADRTLSVGKDNRWLLPVKRVASSQGALGRRRRPLGLRRRRSYGIAARRRPMARVRFRVSLPRKRRRSGATAKGPAAARAAAAREDKSESGGDCRSLCSPLEATENSTARTNRCDGPDGSGALRDTLGDKAVEFQWLKAKFIRALPCYGASRDRRDGARRGAERDAPNSKGRCGRDERDAIIPCCQFNNNSRNVGRNQRTADYESSDTEALDATLSCTVTSSSGCEHAKCTRVSSNSTFAIRGRCLRATAKVLGRKTSRNKRERKCQIKVCACTYRMPRLGRRRRKEACHCHCLCTCWKCAYSALHRWRHRPATAGRREDYYARVLANVRSRWYRGSDGAELLSRNGIKRLSDADSNAPKTHRTRRTRRPDGESICVECSPPRFGGSDGRRGKRSRAGDYARPSPRPTPTERRRGEDGEGAGRSGRGGRPDDGREETTCSDDSVETMVESVSLSLKTRSTRWGDETLRVDVDAVKSGAKAAAGERDLRRIKVEKKVTFVPKGRVAERLEVSSPLDDWSPPLIEFRPRPGKLRGSPCERPGSPRSGGSPARARRDSPANSSRGIARAAEALRGNESDDTSGGSEMADLSGADEDESKELGGGGGGGTSDEEALDIFDLIDTARLGIERVDDELLTEETKATTESADALAVDVVTAEDKLLSASGSQSDTTLFCKHRPMAADSENSPARKVAAPAKEQRTELRTALPCAAIHRSSWTQLELLNIISEANQPNGVDEVTGLRCKKKIAALKISFASTDTAAQDINEAAQDFSKASQDSNNAAQDSKKAAPDSSKAAQDSSKASQDSNTATQDFKKAAQGSNAAAQDSNNAAQGSSKAAQDSGKVAQDSNETTQYSSYETQDFSSAVQDSSNGAQDSCKVAQCSSKIAQDSGKAAQDFNAAAPYYSNGVKDSSKLAKGFSKATSDSNTTAQDSRKASQYSSKAARNSNAAAQGSNNVALDYNDAGQDSNAAAQDSNKAAQGFGEAAQDSKEAAQNFNDATQAAAQDSSNGAQDSSKAIEDSDAAAQDSDPAAKAFSKAASHSDTVAQDSRKAARIFKAAAQDSDEAAQDPNFSTQDSNKAAHDTDTATRDSSVAAQDSDGAAHASNIADQYTSRAAHSSNTAAQDFIKAVRHPSITAQDPKNAAQDAIRAVHGSNTVTQDSENAAQDSNKEAQDFNKEAHDSDKKDQDTYYEEQAKLAKVGFQTMDSAVSARHNGGQRTSFDEAVSDAVLAGGLQLELHSSRFSRAVIDFSYARLEQSLPDKTVYGSVRSTIEQQLLTEEQTRVAIIEKQTAGSAPSRAPEHAAYPLETAANERTSDAGSHEALGVKDAERGAALGGMVDAIDLLSKTEQACTRSASHQCVISAISKMFFKELESPSSAKQGILADAVNQALHGELEFSMRPRGESIERAIILTPFGEQKRAPSWGAEKQDSAANQWLSGELASGKEVKHDGATNSFDGPLPVGMGCMRDTNPISKLYEVSPVGLAEKVVERHTITSDERIYSGGPEIALTVPGSTANDTVDCALSDDRGLELDTALERAVKTLNLLHYVPPTGGVECVQENASEALKELREEQLEAEISKLLGDPALGRTDRRELLASKASCEKLTDATCQPTLVTQENTSQSRADTVVRPTNRTFSREHTAVVVNCRRSIVNVANVTPFAALEDEREAGHERVSVNAIERQRTFVFGLKDETVSAHTALVGSDHGAREVNNSPTNEVTETGHRGAEGCGSASLHTAVPLPSASHKRNSDFTLGCGVEEEDVTVLSEYNFPSILADLPTENFVEEQSEWLDVVSLCITGDNDDALLTRSGAVAESATVPTVQFPVFTKTAAGEAAPLRDAETARAAVTITSRGSKSAARNPSCQGTRTVGNVGRGSDGASIQPLDAAADASSVVVLRSVDHDLRAAFVSTPNVPQAGVPLNVPSRDDVDVESVICTYEAAADDATTIDCSLSMHCASSTSSGTLLAALSTSENDKLRIYDAESDVSIALAHRGPDSQLRGHLKYEQKVSQSDATQRGSSDSVGAECNAQSRKARSKLAVSERGKRSPHSSTPCYLREIYPTAFDIGYETTLSGAQCLVSARSRMRTLSTSRDAIRMDKRRVDNNAPHSPEEAARIRVDIDEAEKISGNCSSTTSSLRQRSAVVRNQPGFVDKSQCATAGGLAEAEMRKAKDGSAAGSSRNRISSAENEELHLAGVPATTNGKSSHHGVRSVSDYVSEATSSAFPSGISTPPAAVDEKACLSAASLSLSLAGASHRHKVVSWRISMGKPTTRNDVKTEHSDPEFAQRHANCENTDSLTKSGYPSALKVDDSPEITTGQDGAAHGVDAKSRRSRGRHSIEERSDAEMGAGETRPLLDGSASRVGSGTAPPESEGRGRETRSPSPKPASREQDRAHQRSPAVRSPRPPSVESGIAPLSDGAAPDANVSERAQISPTSPTTDRCTRTFKIDIACTDLALGNGDLRARCHVADGREWPNVSSSNASAFTSIPSCSELSFEQQARESTDKHSGLAASTDSQSESPSERSVRRRNSRSSGRPRSRDTEDRCSSRHATAVVIRRYHKAAAVPECGYDSGSMPKREGSADVLEVNLEDEADDNETSTGKTCTQSVSIDVATSTSKRAEHDHDKRYCWLDGKVLKYLERHMREDRELLKLISKHRLDRARCASAYCRSKSPPNHHRPEPEKRGGAKDKRSRDTELPGKRAPKSVGGGTLPPPSADLRGDVRLRVDDVASRGGRTNENRRKEECPEYPRNSPEMRDRISSRGSAHGAKDTLPALEFRGGLNGKSGSEIGNGTAHHPDGAAGCSGSARYPVNNAAREGCRRQPLEIKRRQRDSKNQRLSVSARLSPSPEETYRLAVVREREAGSPSRCPRSPATAATRPNGSVRPQPPPEARPASAPRHLHQPVTSAARHASAGNECAPDADVQDLTVRPRSIGRKRSNHRRLDSALPPLGNNGGGVAAPGRSHVRAVFSLTRHR